MKIKWHQLIIISLLCAIYFIGCTQKISKSSGGYILDLYSGSVAVSHDGKSWKEPESGMVLKENDWIKTGPNSFCDIIMPNRGIFRITSDTVISLLMLQEKIEQISIQKGKILVNITKKLDPEGKFTVVTSSAVMAVRGTEFAVETDGQKTKTSVKEGRVAVQKNINLNIPEGISQEEVKDLLEVPVSENEELTMDTEENKKTEEDLNNKLKGVKDINQIKNIVNTEKEGFYKKLKKIDKGNLEKEFKDITSPGKLKKLEEESQKAKDVLKEDFKKLEKNVDEVQKKTGQLGIAKKKVEDKVTTAEQDIKSGAVNKKVDEMKQKMKDIKESKLKKDDNTSSKKSAKEALKEKLNKSLGN